MQLKSSAENNHGLGNNHDLLSDRHQFPHFSLPTGLFMVSHGIADIMKVTETQGNAGRYEDELEVAWSF